MFGDYFFLNLCLGFEQEIVFSSFGLSWRFGILNCVFENCIFPIVAVLWYNNFSVCYLLI